jgi:MFS family permease
LDRFGRKPAMMVGLIISFVTLSLIAAGYYIKEDHPYATTLIIVFCIIFIINLNLTLSPVIWIYVSDISEPVIFSYSMIMGFIGGTIAIVLFPILTKVYFNDNPADIIVFTAVLTLMALILFYFMGIETQGKTEKEIKDEYHRLTLCIRKEKENIDT